MPLFVLALVVECSTRKKRSRDDLQTTAVPPIAFDCYDVAVGSDCNAGCLVEVAVIEAVPVAHRYLHNLAVVVVVVVGFVAYWDHRLMIDPCEPHHDDRLDRLVTCCLYCCCCS